MKKIVFVFVAILFAACSSDDPVQQIDPIVGIWQPESIEIVYTDGSNANEAISPCERNNRFTFGIDGTFFRTSYPEGDDPNCEELVGDPYQSGTWEQISETRYLIRLVCSIPNCDDIEEEYPEEVVFPDNNTMRVKIVEVDDRAPNPIDYLYLFYNRIE